MATHATVTVELRDAEWVKALYAAAKLMAEALEGIVNLIDTDEVALSLRLESDAVEAIATWKALEVDK